MADWPVPYRGHASGTGELPGGSETELLNKPPRPGTLLPGTVQIQGQEGMGLIHICTQEQGRICWMAHPQCCLTGQPGTWLHLSTSCSIPLSRSGKMRRPRQPCFCLLHLVTAQILNWARLVVMLSFYAAVSSSSSPILYLLNATLACVLDVW